MIIALEGHKTKTGRAFGKASFNGLLKNEKYIGTFVWNKHIERVMKKWVGRKHNPDIVKIENAIPAIIEIETWERVQMRMKYNKRNSKNKAKRNYLLSGLIRM